MENITDVIFRVFAERYIFGSFKNIDIYK